MPVVNQRWVLLSWRTCKKSHLLLNFKITNCTRTTRIKCRKCVCGWVWSCKFSPGYQNSVDDKNVHFYHFVMCPGIYNRSCQASHWIVCIFVHNFKQFSNVIDIHYRHDFELFLHVLLIKVKNTNNSIMCRLQ